MTPIGPPDGFAVRAAEGWITLGCLSEATEELDQLTPANQSHPEVVELRWQVAAASADWVSAHRYGERMVALYPEHVSGWIHRAYATRRMEGGGLLAAKAALLPAASLFPEEPMIAFNLACYCAQLGELDAAWEWFCESGRRGNVDAIREAALRDEDLTPIWHRIRGA